MGKPIANPYGDKICPQCGKTFYVNWTDQWVYKRFVNKAERCFCSWKCVREFDKKGEEKQVTKKGKKRVISQELEAQAVDIAMDGGDPIQFLKDHGSSDPQHMWYRIRARLKTEDPESYEKLPRRMPRKDAVKVETPEISAAEAMENMKDAADKFIGECEAMGLMKAETPEQPKIYAAVNYDGMTVRAVEGDFGSYHFQEINGKRWIDYDDKECANQLSMTVDQWRGFLKEVRHAALILGVEL